MNGEEGEGGEEGKIFPMCESIGHRPLRGRCPAPSLKLNHKLLQQGTGTADHPLLLRLFQCGFYNYSLDHLLFILMSFLVACFVSPSVHPSVHRSHFFWVFEVFGLAPTCCSFK